MESPDPSLCSFNSDPSCDSEVAADLSAFWPRGLFTAAEEGSCPLRLGLPPGLCVHVARYRGRVFLPLRLSLPFSIIHASLSPESRRN